MSVTKTSRTVFKKINALGKLRTAILEYQYWCPLFDTTFEPYFYFQIVNTFHNAMYGVCRSASIISKKNSLLAKQSY